MKPRASHFIILFLTLYLLPQVLFAGRTLSVSDFLAKNPEATVLLSIERALKKFTSQAQDYTLSLEMLAPPFDSDQVLIRISNKKGDLLFEADWNSKNMGDLSDFGITTKHGNSLRNIRTQMPEGCKDFLIKLVSEYSALINDRSPRPTKKFQTALNAVLNNALTHGRIGEFYLWRNQPGLSEDYPSGRISIYVFPDLDNTRELPPYSVIGEDEVSGRDKGNREDPYKGKIFIEETRWTLESDGATIFATDKRTIEKLQGGIWFTGLHQSSHPDAPRAVGEIDFTPTGGTLTLDGISWNTLQKKMPASVSSLLNVLSLLAPEANGFEIKAPNRDLNSKLPYKEITFYIPSPKCKAAWGPLFRAPGKKQTPRHFPPPTL